MKHKERSWLKWQVKHAEERKKDQRSEKFSSGLNRSCKLVGKQYSRDFYYDRVYTHLLIVLRA